MAEWTVFLDLGLPYYTKPRVLDMSENPELKINIQTLVEKLPPSLKELRLNGTHCFGTVKQPRGGNLSNEETESDWNRYFRNQR